MKDFGLFLYPNKFELWAKTRLANCELANQISGSRKMKPEPFAPISQLILSRKNGHFAKKMRYLANRGQNHANFLANRKGGRSQFKQSKAI